MQDYLRILQVNALDNYGGAEQVARNLHQVYQDWGYRSWLVVGHQRTRHPEILRLNNDTYRSYWARLGVRSGALLSPLVGKIRGAGQIRNFIQLMGQPQRVWKIWRGHEDFDFPATWQLLNLTPERPDIVHCHNLHGDYFDLRALSWLSQQLPVVLTLHDAWLLSGHCAHSFECSRWQTGCGHCPDLTIYPSIKRDATAYNWQRKRDIYAHSRLYVATPSRWLMQKVEQSMLAPAVIADRVIPNGVDLSIFQPADKSIVRAKLGLPQEARIILFAASGIRQNLWKDYQTMQAAVALIAARLSEQKVIFIALGEKAPPHHIGLAEVQFVPFQPDPQVVACYYQAADIYLHAARVDTFPNTVLEALACATPVVATAVGGIPEQVKGLQVEGYQCQVNGQDLNQYSLAEATGILTPAGDAKGLAEATVNLLLHEKQRQSLSQNAVKDAIQRFNLTLQAENYLKWYQEILMDFTKYNQKEGLKRAN